MNELDGLIFLFPTYLKMIGPGILASITFYAAYHGTGQFGHTLTISRRPWVLLALVPLLLAFLILAVRWASLPDYGDLTDDLAAGWIRSALWYDVLPNLFVFFCGMVLVLNGRERPKHETEMITIILILIFFGFSFASAALYFGPIVLHSVFFELLTRAF